VRHSDLDESQLGPQVYLPAFQTGPRRFFVVARTQSDPADLVSGVRSAIGGVAPTIPLTIRPMADVVAESHLQWSLSSVFLSVFGGGALLLATLGIYGLVSYSVAQRKREMGVRIALGASAAEIRRAVVGDGVRLTAVGLGLGLVATLGIGRLIASTLYGVGPFDPVTLSGVLVLFLGVAALASFIPAARASTTDPITVLRTD
jgi:ABC-type antimicrobial peptide transport system permease subunit